VSLAKTLAGSCCWLGLVSAPFGMASEAMDWLQRMTMSATEHSFRGAFVYERTGSFSTHYVWRDRSEAAVTERFVQTDGPLQEWVRRDGELICSGGAPATAALQETDITFKALSELEQWYDVEILGTTRVASRPVTVVAVRPRDAHRYAFEYYLDQESGLLLKSLMINERQALLERFQFATLELGPVDPAQLDPLSECQPVVDDLATEVLRNSPWQPAWLPPGFAVGDQRSRVLREGDDRQLLSHVYSDGLARFTLFVEPLEGPDVAANLRAQMGPTVAVSRLMQLDGVSYLATVVGEVPPATAERVVGSLLVEQEGGGQ
jgi:sigma-E factor negative regulatory protein RseB